MPLATVLSLAWTVVAAACWFWVPFVGIALATLGFAGTWYGLRGVKPPDRRLPTGNARLLGLGTLAMGIAGTLHAVGTFPDIFFEGMFSPATPNLRLALDHSDIMLPALFGGTRSTWVAYLGFNVSMGLSVAGFALTAWLLARDVPGLVTHDRALQVLFVVFSALWFTVAVVFWFYAPITVTAIATTCHVAFLWRQPQAQPTWN